MSQNVVIFRDKRERDMHAKRFRYEIYHDYDTDIFINFADTAHYDQPHFHNCIELLYVEKGALRVYLGGVEHLVQAGQFIAISGLVIHECCTVGVAARWVLIIPQSVLGSAAKLMDGKTFEHCVQGDDGTMLELMRTLKRVKDKTGLYAPLTEQNRLELTKSLCTSMLITALTVCGLKEQTSLRPLVIDALQYLHLHFRENIRVPEMARELLCTQQTLSDEFRQVFGMTIGMYINHLRARDVYANLREDPDMRLNEAAELSGFGSVRSLLRAYRQEFGCTPSENRS